MIVDDMSQNSEVCRSINKKGFRNRDAINENWNVYMKNLEHIVSFWKAMKSSSK